MSRQLAFWKYENGVYLDNKKVYEEVCCGGKRLDGLAELPIESLVNRVGEVFADYDKLDDRNYESGNGSFSVSTTKQSVLFDCGYSLPETELNKIIDIMLEYDCPFYDPQIETRFDGR